jgi:hypothetical protein
MTPAELKAIQDAKITKEKEEPIKPAPEVKTEPVQAGTTYEGVLNGLITDMTIESKTPTTTSARVDALVLTIGKLKGALEKLA